MKLKKAEVWMRNISKKDVTLHDLNIIIKKGKTVNLFKAQSCLSYELYLESKKGGSLFSRRSYLQEVDGPPTPIKRPEFLNSKDFVKSRTKSMVGTGNEEKDYIDVLTNSFPANAQPLTQEEAWTQERSKVLADLNEMEQGDEGEVFADALFDDDDIDGTF